MFKHVKRLARRLHSDSSGNTLMLFALGMPVFIGGAGLAVDTAQWYQWHREMQYAVDQAAMAGAWSRVNGSTGNEYKTRAQQEIDANLQVVDFEGAPTINLANYDGGTNNSVVVSLSATKTLPFSSMLTGEGATVTVSAQASFQKGVSYTVCMLAVDPDASGAFTLGGSVSGSAECGFGAISTSDTAMVKNGNSDAQAGSLVSNGGVDEGYEDNGTIHANVGGLTDPYESIGEPDPASSPSRTYACPVAGPATTTTTADVSTTTTVTYTYKKGSNANNATPTTYAGAKPDSSSSSGPANQTVPNGTANGTVTGSPSTTTTQVAGNGNNKIFEVATTQTNTTYANVAATTTGGSDGVAHLLPGTYASINVACPTVFEGGIYVVTGTLDFGQNEVVTGTDVMFVLKNPGGMHVNSNSNLSLTGISSATLQTEYGYSSEDAEKLAGMLIYDKHSTDQWKVNGNASLNMDGIFYMPKREVWFNGNSSVSGRCLMVVAAQITFTGNNEINSFCTPAGSNGIDLGGSETSVKLVA